jgi:uncharacterized coiled-coil DUF342 family protein
MKMSNKIREIAIQIQELIDEEVENKNKNQEYKDELESFIYRFEELLLEARDVVEDFKSQGLSINTIEAEGYLRGFLTIRSILPTID